MTEELTEFEKKVADFLAGRGEVLTSNMPAQMSGALPNLKRKGVVDIFKRRTSRRAPKKRTFVRLRRTKNDA
jgi:hypothetical protein